MTARCHCGRPLHYRDPEIARIMHALVAELGEYVVVQVGGRRWRVPRHYIALHGLRGADLPSLGFSGDHRMINRFVIDEQGFHDLVVGKPVTLKSIGASEAQVILEDIGWEVMLDAVAQAMAQRLGINGITVTVMQPRED